MRLLIVIQFLFVQIAFAQFRFPDLSPDADLSQTVGYTNFKIHYGRPAARERKIFGELVPYGRLWRTGAGKCTTFYFDKAVTISGKKIPAGIYSLASIPGEKEWTIMLNSDTSKIYGDPREYNTATEVVRFTVKAEKAFRYYESLTIDIDAVREDATIFLNWEHTQIQFVIKTEAYQQILADIPKHLAKEPDNSDLYLMSAWYYYMNNENPEQALLWVNKVLTADGGEDRWAYQLKFDLLERMKNYDEAEKTAGEAIAFLTKEKPDEWQASVSEYQERMKKWKRS